MKYSNLEIVDFIKRVTEGKGTLFNHWIPGVSWNNYHSWVRYYAINDESNSKYIVGLRNLAPIRVIVFQRDRVITGKELKEKINSWL